MKWQLQHLSAKSGSLGQNQATVASDHPPPVLSCSKTINQGAVCGLTSLWLTRRLDRLSEAAMSCLSCRPTVCLMVCLCVYTDRQAFNRTAWLQQQPVIDSCPILMCTALLHKQGFSPLHSQICMPLGLLVDN